MDKKEEIRGPVTRTRSGVLGTPERVLRSTDVRRTPTRSVTPSDVRKTPTRTRPDSKSASARSTTRLRQILTPSKDPPKSDSEPDKSETEEKPARRGRRSNTPKKETEPEQLKAQKNLSPLSEEVNTQGEPNSSMSKQSPPAGRKRLSSAKRSVSPQKTAAKDPSQELETKRSERKSVSPDKKSTPPQQVSETAPKRQRKSNSSQPSEEDVESSQSPTGITSKTDRNSFSPNRNSSPRRKSRRQTRSNETAESTVEPSTQKGFESTSSPTDSEIASKAGRKSVSPIKKSSPERKSKGQSSSNETPDSPLPQEGLESVRRSKRKSSLPKGKPNDEGKSNKTDDAPKPLHGAADSSLSKGDFEDNEEVIEIDRDEDFVSVCENSLETKCTPGGDSKRESCESEDSGIKEMECSVLLENILTVKEESILESFDNILDKPFFVSKKTTPTRTEAPSNNDVADSESPRKSTPRKSLPPEDEGLRQSLKKDGIESTASKRDSLTGAPDSEQLAKSADLSCGIQSPGRVSQQMKLNENKSPEKISSPKSVGCLENKSDSEEQQIGGGIISKSNKKMPEDSPSEKAKSPKLGSHKLLEDFGNMGAVGEESVVACSQPISKTVQGRKSSKKDSESDGELMNISTSKDLDFTVDGDIKFSNEETGSFKKSGHKIRESLDRIIQEAEELLNAKDGGDGDKVITKSSSCSPASKRKSSLTIITAEDKDLIKVSQSNHKSSPMKEKSNVKIDFDSSIYSPGKKPTDADKKEALNNSVVSNSSKNKSVASDTDNEMEKDEGANSEDDLIIDSSDESVPEKKSFSESKAQSDDARPTEGMDVESEEISSDNSNGRSIDDSKKNNQGADTDSTKTSGKDSIDEDAEEGEETGSDDLDLGLTLFNSSRTSTKSVNDSIHDDESHVSNSSLSKSDNLDRTVLKNFPNDEAAEDEGSESDSDFNPDGSDESGFEKNAASKRKSISVKDFIDDEAEEGEETDDDDSIDSDIGNSTIGGNKKKNTSTSKRKSETISNYSISVNDFIDDEAEEGEETYSDDSFIDDESVDSVIENSSAGENKNENTSVSKRKSETVSSKSISVEDFIDDEAEEGDETYSDDDSFIDDDSVDSDVEESPVSENEDSEKSGSEEEISGIGELDETVSTRALKSKDFNVLEKQNYKHPSKSSVPVEKPVSAKKSKSDDVNILAKSSLNSASKENINNKDNSKSDAFVEKPASVKKSKSKNTELCQKGLIDHDLQENEIIDDMLGNSSKKSKVKKNDTKGDISTRNGYLDEDKSSWLLERQKHEIINEVSEKKLKGLSKKRKSSEGDVFSCQNLEILPKKHKTEPFKSTFSVEQSSSNEKKYNSNSLLEPSRKRKLDREKPDSAKRRKLCASKQFEVISLKASEKDSRSRELFNSRHQTQTTCGMFTVETARSSKFLEKTVPSADSKANQPTKCGAFTVFKFSSKINLPATQESKKDLVFTNTCCFKIKNSIPVKKPIKETSKEQRIPPIDQSQQIRANTSSSKDARKQLTSIESNSECTEFKAHIYNLPKVNAIKLREVLASHGIKELKAIDLSLCKPKRFLSGKGHGIITFKTEKEMKRAIETRIHMSGKDVRMRPDKSYSPKTDEAQMWLIQCLHDHIVRLEAHEIEV